jgi:hypothetical protein
MTHIEKMEMWLDAMETELAVDFMDGGAVGEAAEKLCDAIASLRQAIAEAEKQEPVKLVAYNCMCGRQMRFESVNGVVAPQRAEPDDIASIIACRDMLDAQPVPPRRIEGKSK